MRPKARVARAPSRVAPIACVGMAPSWQTGAMAAEMLVAQFSDLHLCADPLTHPLGVDPADAFARALASLPAQPDVLVLTGDLADDGSRTAYERIDALTANVAARRYVIPGNHD